MLSDGTVRRERTSNLLTNLSYSSALLELFSNCAVLVENAVVLGRFLCLATDRTLLGELLSYCTVGCEGTSNFLSLATDLFMSAKNRVTTDWTTYLAV